MATHKLQRVRKHIYWMKQEEDLEFFKDLLESIESDINDNSIPDENIEEYEKYASLVTNTLLECKRKLASYSNQLADLANWEE